MIEDLFHRSWSWYGGLPWYWKILGALVLVLIIVLAVLAGLKRFFDPGPMKGGDGIHGELVDNALEREGKTREELDKLIKLKKKSLYTTLNSAREIDASTLDRREAIEKATTFEELDELQKRFGL